MRRVEFTIVAEMLAFPHPDHRTYAEPGAILAVIGPSAASGEPVKLAF